MMLLHDITPEATRANGIKEVCTPLNSGQGATEVTSDPNGSAAHVGIYRSERWGVRVRRGDMNTHLSILTAAWVHVSEQSAPVECKDALTALVAASVTLAGFALVFLGIVITRPVSEKKLRSEFRMIAGLLLIFWLDLLSAGCSLAWFYLNAPGNIHVPLLGISPGFLYQAGWIIFWFTAVISYYVVVITIKTVLGRDKKKR